MIEYIKKDGKGKIWWKCICDCGEQIETYTLLLRSKKQQSCGCLRKETSAKHCEGMTKHGHYKGNKPTPEWSAWAALRARCYVKTHKQYKNYGGRGIAVCERWHTFDNFLEDMGKRPDKGYSIDRIDNSKGYEPGNCRWATTTEQNNNMRTNRRVSYNGEELTLAQWCKKLHISRGLWIAPLQRLGSHEKALEEIIEKLKVL